MDDVVVDDVVDVLASDVVDDVVADDIVDVLASDAVDEVVVDGIVVEVVVSEAVEAGWKEGTSEISALNHGL